MIRRDLAPRGITDRRVLAAMAWVPRELFVHESAQRSAYADIPLPIGAGQTISQPYIVALMTQEARLTRQSRVLDVGTGSGYHTAVMAKIARTVWSIERVPELAHDAAHNLDRAYIHNVTLVVGDGARGWPDAAPFDAIVVAAAAPHPPQSLLDQLAEGGRLVIPLGSSDIQELTVLTRTGDQFSRRDVTACRFVPFVSDAISDERN
jgi:protein-L-isoaspartate(D-aspartate) O-methyltransferase